MKNIKNSAVAEKSLAAHRLLKIKSTEDKSYQISAENCLRKRDWYGLVHFSQRKRCGNAAETRNATSFCSYVFPPSGNVTETWTIRFPQDFRNTETPYFTLCIIIIIIKSYFFVLIRFPGRAAAAFCYSASWPCLDFQNHARLHCMLYVQPLWPAM